MKKIKLPKLSLPKIKFKRPTLGQSIYWVIGLGLAIGLFIAARGFFVCI